MDHIELALLDVPERDDTSPVVAVRINGEPLEALWGATGALAVAPIWIHETYDRPGNWDGGFAGSTLLGPDDAVLASGVVAVVTCTCGFFECAGGTATIDVDDETVTWRAFRAVSAGGGSREAVQVGPFRFDRLEYERTIEALRRDVRAVLNG